jgi:hypothetical protein
MGFYINELEDGTPLPKIGKADFILNNVELTAEINFPKAWDVIENLEEKAVIAVVENGIFDAAAYVDKHLYNEIDYEITQRQQRKMRFILMPRTVASKLSGIDSYLKA